MLKKLTKNKVFIISISVVIICIFIILSVFAIKTFLRIIKENEMVESVYKVASIKYNEDNWDKCNEKIEKAISKYQKSKINTNDEINDRLLELSDRLIKEKHLNGAESVLNKCSNKKSDIKKKYPVIYNLAIGYYNNKEFLEAYEMFEKCIDYSDSVKKKSNAAYNYAEKMYKEGNYEDAYVYYEKSGKSGIEKKIKEAKYQHIVKEVLGDISTTLHKYLDEDECDLLDELGNYRYSKEISLWSEVNKKVEEYKESDVETVEDRLKLRLKDPFSYIRGSKTSLAYFQKSSLKGYAKIKVIVALRYYAKNSFGARIGDYHFDSVEHVINLKGIKYKKAKRIVDMSATDLAEKAKKVK